MFFSFRPPYLWTLFIKFKESYINSVIDKDVSLVRNNTNVNLTINDIELDELNSTHFSIKWAGS